MALLATYESGNILFLLKFWCMLCYLNIIRKFCPRPFNMMWKFRSQHLLFRGYLGLIFGSGEAGSEFTTQWLKPPFSGGDTFSIHDVSFLIKSLFFLHSILLNSCVLYVGVLSRVLKLSPMYVSKICIFRYKKILTSLKPLKELRMMRLDLHCLDMCPRCHFHATECYTK